MSDRPGAFLSEQVGSAGVDAAPPREVVEPLLEWSHSELRDLPWRRTRDPWKILVSEVMLQQTQVARVIERWHIFLGDFPTATACADAGSAAIIERWAGLGYNRRAVNLWRCAVAVRDEHRGRLPADVAALQRLPGIGPYTARAVAVFAFEQHEAVLDTNVGRLLARWSGRSLTAREGQVMADALVPAGDSWRWNQTLFDFAAAVCTKRAPACAACPLLSGCAWRGDGDDPALGSAGVSKGQSRFEGSRRQVRGRILDAVRTSPVRLDQIAAFGRPGDDESAVMGVVRDLVDDGLVELEDGSIRLPGR